jgi:hypothetical protein
MVKVDIQKLVLSYEKKERGYILFLFRFLHLNKFKCFNACGGSCFYYIYSLHQS